MKNHKNISIDKKYLTGQIVDIKKDKVKVAQEPAGIVIIKNIDPDAHANLYILYRKLLDGKISEVDALVAFEAYDNVRYYDDKILL